ncbi:MAG: RNA 3'-terminal phosphate cyclase [Candidatus Micrarchaeota archaeon]|nr:RNA 3'-terminal phosphate cyclase [Candidatus Micrarchaeota archaeon]
MIEVDGSHGEGGGQILRTALSFACLSGKKVRITRIRAGRNPPGLAAQHLAVCRLLQSMSGAKVQGGHIGSTELSFEPGKLIGGKFSFDIGTAGSCALLLQAALPVMLMCEKECELEAIGGTHVKGAPTFEYIENVFLPAIRMLGAECQAKMLKAGFYPKGGGRVVAKTKPSKISGLAIRKIEGKASYCIVYGGLPDHVAEREEKAVEGLLGAHAPVGRRHKAPSDSPGNAITIWKGLIGASVVGERGKRAEEVASEACKAFLAEDAGFASVDSHLADQLLIYATLAEGKTAFFAPKITSHLSTNAAVLSRLSERDIRIGEDGKVEVV